MLDFAKELFFSAAAKTSIGQDFLIKPLIKKQFKKTTERFNKDIKTFTKLTNIKRLKEKEFKPLSNALKKLRRTEKKFLKALSSDILLSPLTEVAAHHVSGYKANDFAKAIKHNKSANKLKKFAAMVANRSNYKKLSKFILDTQNFTKMTPERQQEILQRLEDPKFINAIAVENNIKNFRLQVKDMSKHLFEEMCTSEERTLVKKAFETLAKTYISEFNKINETLVAELPSFFKAELIRVQKLDQSSRSGLEDPEKSKKNIPNVRTGKKIVKDSPKNDAKEVEIPPQEKEAIKIVGSIKEKKGNPIIDLHCDDDSLSSSDDSSNDNTDSGMGKYCNFIGKKPEETPVSADQLVTELTHGYVADTIAFTNMTKPQDKNSETDLTHSQVPNVEEKEKGKIRIK